MALDRMVSCGNNIMYMYRGRQVSVVFRLVVTWGLPSPAIGLPLYILHEERTKKQGQLIADTKHNIYLGTDNCHFSAHVKRKFHAS